MELSLEKNTSHEIGRKVEEVEGLKRNLSGVVGKIITVIAIIMSLYHLYTAGFGMIEALRHRALHLSFALCLIFLLFPASKKSDLKRLPWYDVVLALLGVAAGLYIIVNYDQLAFRAGWPTQWDTAFGILTIVLVLEATRRALGPALSVVGLIFLGYAYLGPHIPGIFAHRGANLESLAEHLYLTTEGLFGIPIGVSATFVFLFILFGSFLEVTGAGQFLIRLSMGLFGHMRGGPAKAAILASGAMGSINGSSVANVVTTGSFTIPLMKKVGFKPHVAGAVEVAASSTGQYLPPIMGAAAFAMSEITGIPYITIALAATLPALLDYVAMMMMVHFEACKNNIEGIPRAELPVAKETIRLGWHLLIPIFGIIAMLVSGFTPLRAAFIGIILVYAASWIQAHTRITWQDALVALERGAKNALGVAAACAVAGIIVGVVSLTGLGLRLTDIVISVAGGNLYLAMGLTILASIIMGLAMPTTAKYIIVSTVTAPILVNGFGVPLLAAHLFVLYYAILADDTPPVGVAAYAAAGIAKSDPWKTGIMGFKFDISGMLIPVVFVLAPALLMIDTTFLEVVKVVISTCVGLVGMSAFLQNWLVTKCYLHERILLLVAALLLVSPILLYDFLGLAIIVGIWMLQWRRRPQTAEQKAAVFA